MLEKCFVFAGYFGLCSVTFSSSCVAWVKDSTRLGVRGSEKTIIIFSVHLLDIFRVKILKRPRMLSSFIGLVDT